jgi:Heavy metal binding domain
MSPARTWTIGLLSVLLASVTMPAGQTRVPAAGVRLHHLHFRTADVSAAMADAVKIHGGIRAIVSGLGVGVRVVDTYLLFDSLSGAASEREASPPPGASNVFVEAAQWLGSHGVEATVSDAGTRMLLAIPPELTLDHIAFATPNLDAAVSALRSTGATLAYRTGDSLFYRADGVMIEITRETEASDTFWCPMHPGVRASYAGKCPLCSMDLVPIAPPRVGEYRVDVTQVPSPNGRGISALKLRIRDPESDQDVEMFAETHERLLHLFIIGRDLRYFAHEHPVRTDDGFELGVNLPPGAYMLIADFLPGGGYPQMVHRAIVTPGYVASPFGLIAEPAEDLSEKVVDGIRVRLALNQRGSRSEAMLRFNFSDATTNAPIRDLELYLGSSGHLLLVSPDVTHSVHAHPEGKTFGPDVNFGVIFPRAGTYKVWIQIQRAGRVVTAPFVVRISE